MLLNNTKGLRLRSLFVRCRISLQFAACPEEHRVELVGPDGENPLLAVDRAYYERGPGQ
jgi:hypothetical protein